MVTKSYLPPASQRPRIISRFEAPENNQIPAAQENTGVIGTKTQVVQRVKESSDIRFPFETSVQQFRGDVQGRSLRETAVPEQISDLPKRVQPFSNPNFNTFFGSLNSAEAAALGMSSSTVSTNASASTGSSSEAKDTLQNNEAKDTFQISESKDTAEKGETRSRDEMKPNGEPLSDDDLRKVEKLKDRDSEVRRHEQAHVSAGGQHIRGGIKYDYTQGPNGKNEN